MIGEVIGWITIIILLLSLWKGPEAIQKHEERQAVNLYHRLDAENNRKLGNKEVNSDG